jgi:hypothetical protein
MLYLGLRAEVFLVLVPAPGKPSCVTFVLSGSFLRLSTVRQPRSMARMYGPSAEVKADAYTQTVSQEITKPGSFSWRTISVCLLQCVIKRMDEGLDLQDVFLVVSFFSCGGSCM